MAKDTVEYNGKQGVWRTISGRRVFIAEGEDLRTAMKNSGKFKSDFARNRKYYTDDMVAKRKELSKEVTKTNRVIDAKVNQYGNAKDDLTRKMISKDDSMFRQKREALKKDIKDIDIKAIARKQQDKLDKLKGNRTDYDKWEDGIASSKEEGDALEKYYEKMNNDFSAYEKKDVKQELAKQEATKKDNFKEWQEKNLDKKYGKRYENERMEYESKVYGVNVKEADAELKRVFPTMKYTEDVEDDFKQWQTKNNVDYKDYNDYVENRTKLNPNNYDSMEDYDNALRKEYLSHRRQNNAKTKLGKVEGTDNLVSYAKRHGLNPKDANTLKQYLAASRKYKRK